MKQWVVMLAVWLGCSGASERGGPDGPAAPPPTAVASAPPPTAVASAPPPGPATTAGSAPADTRDPGCADLESRAAKTLAAAPGTCTKSADCTCYPGAIIPGCGGVTDAATASAITALYNDYRTKKCLRTHCAPRACDAACENGRCVEARR